MSDAPGSRGFPFVCDDVVVYTVLPAVGTRVTKDRNTDHNRNQPPSRGAHRLRVLRAAWRRAEKHPSDTELGYDVDDWTTLPCPAGIVSFVPSELDPAKDEFIVCDTDKLVNLSEWG